MTGRRSGLALLLFAALSGCGGARSEPPTPRPAASFELHEGDRLFAAYCAACHGESGRGDGAYLSAGAPAAPPDFAAPGARERLRRDQLTARLGSPKASGEVHCPPWGNTFSHEDIEALARFVERLAGALLGNRPEADHIGSKPPQLAPQARDERIRPAPIIR